MTTLDDRSAQLADAIAERVASALLGPPPPPVVIETIDEELLAAALEVSDAYTHLDRSKHTRDEIRARLRLERRARDLRALVRSRKGLRHV